MTTPLPSTGKDAAGIDKNDDDPLNMASILAFAGVPIPVNVNVAPRSRA